jgi:hypothetical protein
VKPFYLSNQTVLPFKFNLYRYAKLVGFDGDGYLGVTLGERDFAPFLEALRADVHAHVLRDAASSYNGGGGGGGRGDAHTLPIKTQFYFHVTKASQRLNGEIQAAVRGAVATKSDEDGAGDLALIPHDLTEVGLSLPGGIRLFTWTIPAVINRTVLLLQKNVKRANLTPRA